MAGYQEQCACGAYTDHAPCPRCTERLIAKLQADLAACQRERDELRGLLPRWLMLRKEDCCDVKRNDDACNSCDSELCAATRKVLGVE